MSARLASKRPSTRDRAVTWALTALCAFTSAPSYNLKKRTGPIVSANIAMRRHQQKISIVRNHERQGYKEHFQCADLDDMRFSSLLMTAISAARSDQIPVLNVQQVCRRIAQQGMDPSETGGPDLAMSQCNGERARGPRRIGQSVVDFCVADKQHCTREATMGGEASYTDLITCLEMARDVRKMRIPHDHPLEDIEQ